MAPTPTKCKRAWEAVGADLSQPIANSLACLDRGICEPLDGPMNWRWAAINRPLPWVDEFLLIGPFASLNDF